MEEEIGLMKRYPCGLSEKEWNELMSKTKDSDDAYINYISNRKSTWIERLFWFIDGLFKK